MKPVDLLLLGAGLANTLLAYRLRQKDPSLEVMMLDASDGPRADRTWSFHESDVSPAVWRWLEPLADRTWDGYDVEFPAYRRELRGSKYASLRGTSLLDKTNLSSKVRWNAVVVSAEPGSITLATGEKIVARAVVDGRGQGKFRARGEGYQKFYGLQVKLRKPHGLMRPVVMDATVPQTGGYRFLYLLPWDDYRVLVEDTYYADDSALDREALRSGVEAYVRERGWEIEAIEGEECAALPIPMFPAADHPGASEIGVAGGFFHPVTGYSVPYAAAVAEGWDPRSDDAVLRLLRLREELTKRHSFYHLLNRMLFLAAGPLERRKIFEKFYRQPEGLVQRFYAGRTTVIDQALILTGRPPVAIAPAIKAMWQKEEAL